MTEPVVLGSATCDLVGEVNAIAFRNCIPLNASCEITLRCNARCEHCYNFDRSRPREVPGELSFDEWKNLFGQLREAGTLFLSLTGGEVMCHPRFFDLLDETSRLHFVVQVLTNGTMLTPEAADRIAAHANIMTVAVTLYGAKAETHDSVTRAPDSFLQALRGARLLQKRGVHVTLKYIVMRRNHRDLEAAQKIAGEMGMPLVVDTQVTARYDGAKDSLDTRVTPEELETLYRGPLRSILPQAPQDPGENDWMCHCARGTCAISAVGDVYPCIAVPWKAGNVRERPFAEIWKSSPLFERIRGMKLSDFPDCKPCPLKRWCRRSNGTVYCNTGEYTSIDPWLCREAEIIRDILDRRP